MPRKLSPEAKRLRTALDLQAFGIEMMRMNLRREHPDEDEESISRRMAEWLAEEEDWPREEFRRVPWPRRPS